MEVDLIFSALSDVHLISKRLTVHSHSNLVSLILNYRPQHMKSKIQNLCRLSHHNPCAPSLTPLIRCHSQYRFKLHVTLSKCVVKYLRGGLGRWRSLNCQQARARGVGGEGVPHERRSPPTKASLHPPPDPGLLLTRHQEENTSAQKYRSHGPCRSNTYVNAGVVSFCVVGYTLSDLLVCSDRGIKRVGLSYKEAHKKL